MVWLRCISLCLVVATCASKLSGRQGVLMYSDDLASEGYNVTYDNRSFIVGGQRTLLLSGSVHYGRSTPAMWPSIFQSMAEDGLNMVETYLFWNLHEFSRGQKYNMSGFANWTHFVELAGEAGLFVNLRIGPYVCAEWNYGGLPVWINTIPDMAVRSYNEPWKKEMSRFVKDMAVMAEPYLARNGGPIIMAQIENEYHWDNPDYIKWCGDLAASLKLDIPWVMCNGESAPNTINTCNGFDCTAYAESHAEMYPGQPLAWTENEGWFQIWSEVPGTGKDNRTPENVAYTIARWFARGGAHHNYYMWYGGNHFGRWAGASVTNMYADTVNLHSDGLHNEPKKTHLQRLHNHLANFSATILSSPSQANNKTTVLVYDAKSGKYVKATDQYAFVYLGTESEGAMAFVENSIETEAKVKFMNSEYTLPGLSVSIVNLTSLAEVYNTGKVDSKGLPTQRIYTTLLHLSSWKGWQEKVGELQGGYVATHPLEQLEYTKDETNYLFYQTNVMGITELNKTLVVDGEKAQAMFMYIDGSLRSWQYNDVHNTGPVTFTFPFQTSDTNSHQLTLLSVNMGNHNWFTPGGYVEKGIVGSVTLASQSITEGKWLHRAKLEGEILQVYTEEGSGRVPWVTVTKQFIHTPLVWYQTTFPRVKVSEGHSLLLDLKGMNRGHIYLNGMDLGQYWLIEVSETIVQRYYFIPPGLLQDTNLLTLVEEVGLPTTPSVALLSSNMVVPP